MPDVLQDSADVSIADESDVLVEKTNTCIEIVADDDETFEWQYIRNGVAFGGTTFVLRLVPETLKKKFERDHTTRRFERGQRVETLDSEAYANDVVNYAIVDWRGLRNAKTGQDLPCERRYKIKLPERVQAEIIRVCLGKEAGLDLAEQRSREKNG